MESSYKIGICLLTNEPEYLEEWLEHHRNMDFDHFFIYFDSNTKIDDYPNLEEKDCSFKIWDCQNSPNGQMKAYEDCCKLSNMDYLLFIDSDEFIMTKNSMNIKQVLENLYYAHGKFDGLALYWRFYGNNPPFEVRNPVKNYKQYHENGHIKILINPKKVISFPNPHLCITKGKIINELGDIVKEPVGIHTSKNIWIKHIWTRSRKEWATKVNRKGWYEYYDRKMEEFDNYNKLCVMTDV